jgi:hypothetical protein
MKTTPLTQCTTTQVEIVVPVGARICPRYFPLAVTEDGRVWCYARRVWRSAQLKKKNARYGYLHVSLYTKMIPVHNLVADAFIGKHPGEGMCVNHIDHNSLNNAASNLEYITLRENGLKAVEHYKMREKGGEWSDIGKRYGLLSRGNGRVPKEQRKEEIVESRPLSVRF